MSKKTYKSKKKVTPVKKEVIENAVPEIKKVIENVKPKKKEVSGIIFVVKVTGFNGSGKMFYSGDEINGKHYPTEIIEWIKKGYLRKK